MVQALKRDQGSQVSVLSPELMVLIFSHLDECSLATVPEVRDDTVSFTTMAAALFLGASH